MALDSARMLMSMLSDTRALLREGNVAQASKRCEALKAIAPTDARVWRLAAELAFHTRLPHLALDCLKTAITCAPLDLALQVEYAGCLLRLGRRGDALAVALRLRKHKIDHPELQDALGTLLTHCERADYAIGHFQAAIEGCPANSTFRYNLAMAQRMVGALESAETTLDIVLRARPLDGEALLARSGLRIQTQERNHSSDLKKALLQLKHNRASIPALFALAKELEDLREYRESWHYLSLGAAAHRRTFDYHVDTDVATVDWIMEAFSGQQARSTGCPDAQPIFIVGMPRTGSTLLERILSGKPELKMAGELPDFAVALSTMARAHSANVSLRRRELIAAAAAVDVNLLAIDYLSRVRALVGEPARFTDKMPLNYLYCGWIRNALPRARILHVTRHPLATCYSVFKTLFNQAYPFSYDLCELADYYVGYRRLMDYWHRELPGCILDVSYERLTMDPEAQMREVFDFCELEWDSRCLDVRRGMYVTSTASAAQVRQPINRSTVDLWKEYRRELEPVAQRLVAAGIPI